MRGKETKRLTEKLLSSLPDSILNFLPGKLLEETIISLAKVAYSEGFKDALESIEIKEATE